jgi:hypothetical protein
VTDNLGNHKGAGAQDDRGRRSDAALPAALQSRLQPDEESHLEAQSASTQSADRIVDAPWHRIGALLEEFTPQECANLFAEETPL